MVFNELIKNFKEDKDFAVAVTGISILVLSLVGFIYYLVHTVTVEAVVTKRSWRIVQKVEELRRGINEEGWYLPVDAYAVRTETRLHHYNQVVDHYTYERVSKNSSRKKAHYRSDPEYRTYDLYKVNRWISGEPRVTSGDTLSVVEPSVELRDADQRLADKEETFILYFEQVLPDNADPKPQWQHTVSYEEWLRWKDDQMVILDVNKLGVMSIRNRPE